MGWLTRIRGEGPSVTRDASDDRWFAPTGWMTAAGIPVTPELALNFSAIWKGVRLYADNMGRMPCIIYRRRADGGKDRAPDHPLHDLLRWQPNTYQTAFEFWEMIAGHVVLRGSAYVEIVDSPGGYFADQLIPRHPARMRPERLPNGRIRYQYTDEFGQAHTYTQDEIMHIRGFSDDGLTGLGTADVAANAIGTAMAADQYAARFFRQGAAPALAVIHPEELGEEGLQNLASSVRQYFAGLAHTHGVLPLEENVKLEKIGIEPEKAQLLSTREYAIEEIARFLNLPHYALGSLKTPTNASAEQFRQDLVDFSFGPLAVRFEQAIQRDLILATQTYFAEFLFDALFRGNLEARANYYTKALGGGPWMTENDVRGKENLNPVPGGDEMRRPMNMGAGASGSTLPANGGNGARLGLIVRQAAAQLVRQEMDAARQAGSLFAEDASGWQAWLRVFYEEHAGRVAETLQLPPPVAREYAARQGTRLAEGGLVAMADWERTAVIELTGIALNPSSLAA